MGTTFEYPESSGPSCRAQIETVFQKAIQFFSRTRSVFGALIHVFLMF